MSPSTNRTRCISRILKSRLRATTSVMRPNYLRNPNVQFFADLRHEIRLTFVLPTKANQEKT
jgi:hypothetical protein